MSGPVYFGRATGHGGLNFPTLTRDTLLLVRRELRSSRAGSTKAQASHSLRDSSAVSINAQNGGDDRRLWRGVARQRDRCQKRGRRDQANGMAKKPPRLVERVGRHALEACWRRGPQRPQANWRLAATGSGARQRESESRSIVAYGRSPALAASEVEGRRRRARESGTHPKISIR